MRNITKIVVHCSASPQGRGDDASTIHKWHKANGWSGIGYHAVILEDGTIQNGRPDYWKGAHAKGANRNTLGICLIGTTKFTEAQFEALRGWIKEKQEKYDIGNKNVIGHYEVPRAYKTCPNIDMNEFRRTI